MVWRRSCRPPHRFVALSRPGIELLTEPIALVNARPKTRTGALLEHFDGAAKAELHELPQARRARWLQRASCSIRATSQPWGRP